MKTHKVIDIVYHDDEFNEVFRGTFQYWLDELDGFSYSVNRQCLIKEK